MALNRDQVGLTFQIDVDAMDAQQQLALFRGVVEGVAAETREQFGRMGDQFRTFGTQVRNAGQQLSSSFGDAARGQLSGFVGQFGLIGDAASGMIPSLTGSAAAMAGIAGAAVAVTGAFGAAIMSTAEYAGSLNDLADISNLEIETLQGLYAGSALVGESFESLTSTTVIFQRKLQSAKDGNEEMIATFRALGVDLNGTVDQAFRQAIERIASLDDGSQKTALSTQLFGKSATSLMKIMKEMDGSYANLIQKADDFGVKLSKNDVEAADNFGKSLDILMVKAKGAAFSMSTFALDVVNTYKELLNFGRVVDQIEKTYMPETFKKNQAAKDAKAQADKAKADADARRRGEIQADFDFEQLREQKRKEFEANQKDKPSGGGGGRAAKVDNTEAEIKRARAALAAAQLAAIENEGIRLQEISRRQVEEIEAARLEAAKVAGNKSKTELAALRIATLEQEHAITLKKIQDFAVGEIAERLNAEQKVIDARKQQGNAALDALADQLNREQALRDAALDRIAEGLNTEQQIIDAKRQQRNAALDALAEDLNREQELIDAADARKRAAQEADASSPLNIFGAAGQEAADRGAGIFGQLGASANAALTQVRKNMGDFGTMMTDVFSGVASGLQNMLQGFIMTGKIGGQAFKAMAAQIISALVAQSAVKAIFHLAEGFAAMARYDFTSATQNFTAAKMYGVVAGVAAAAAVGISAIGPGGGGGGGQFLTENRGGGGSVMREQGSRRNEPQVIIIRAETEPGVMVSKVIQDYKSNGEMRGVLRRDLLGEY